MTDLTVQQYLDKLAQQILVSAKDGTMPPEMLHEIGELLVRVKADIDKYGHAQTGLPQNILNMPWDEFCFHIDKRRKEKQH